MSTVTGVPGPDHEPDREWWRSAVVYQIYPRSFADSDGDGIGDLRGVLDHVDHLVDLGVDVVWLSPIYPSPQDDNGYDISDYRDVDPTFGTLADLEELVETLHGHGIRLVMDLVVNHTSDEHPWFVESRADRTNAKADWYVWRDPRPGFEGGTPGAEPTNWESFFSGPAWEWVPERGQYYLHLFSVTQPDLDWENPVVRAEVHALMDWWLDRGVDGFRMDVINLVSKDQSWPDGVVGPGGLGDGTPYAMNGPRLEEFLHEMRHEVFDPRPGTFLTVGEMPGVTPELAARFTDVSTGSLSMVFQFEHVELDAADPAGPAGGGKWSTRRTAVLDLKRSLDRWQAALAGGGWNSLYWDNHDQPRAVSRFGDDGRFWRESATALATVLHLQRGTPYVYQGEEIGMTNAPFATIGDYRDIESLRHHAAATARGEDPEAVLATLAAKSRDHARTPVQWTDGPYAGFSEAGDSGTAAPWIAVNPNHAWLNVASQRDDPGSVLAHHRALIAVRHERDVVVDGAQTPIHPDHPAVWAYARTTAADRLAVYANLSGEQVQVELDPADVGAGVVLGNLPGRPAALPPGETTVTLGAWEALVLGGGPLPSPLSSPLSPDPDLA